MSNVKPPNYSLLAIQIQQAWLSRIRHLSHKDGVKILELVDKALGRDIDSYKEWAKEEEESDD